MNILDKHNDYETNIKRWKRCRDVIEGQDAVHGGGENYLPRLDKQTDDQYASYLERSWFFNASDRTVQGMIGLVMRKEPTIVPEDTAFEEDVSRRGVSMTEYAQDILEQVISIGRAGTLLDYAKMPEGLTVAQAEDLGEMPTMAMYIAENIFNWEYAFTNNVYQLTRVVLFDGIDSSAGKDHEIYHYRELLLDQEQGVYIQNLYEGNDEQSEPNLISEIIPKMNGNTLKNIPFMFHIPDTRPEKIAKPPLLDLFDANIKHYQQEADQSHALHYVALPTPWMTGVDKDDAPDSVGPQRMWILPNENAKVGLLEFTGKGIAAIDEKLNKLELAMAQLGSRMLAPDLSTANETATAVTIKSMAENSVLAKLTKSVSKQLTRLWALGLEWAGTPDEEAVVELNIDFVAVPLAGADLTALVGSWQAGAFSKETLFGNLKKGEIIPEGNTFEDEEKAIEEETPAGIELGTPGLEEIPVDTEEEVIGEPKKKVDDE